MNFDSISNFRDMVDNIYSDLDFDYESYALEDDKKLTQDAIEFKKRILEHMKESEVNQ